MVVVVTVGVVGMMVCVCVCVADKCKRNGEIKDYCHIKIRDYISSGKAR
jgi:hypothetical protein